MRAVMEETNPTSSPDSMQQALQQVPLFDSLPPELLTRVARLAQRRRLAGSSLMWSRGERRDALVVLLDGRMKAVLLSEDGREITLHVFAPYEFLGEMSIVDGSTHSASIVTIDPCEVAWIPGEALRELMREHPQLVWHLLEVQTRRVRHLSDELASHAFMTTCRRVARKLVQTAADQACVNVSHQELAGLIGSTRESVTRALAELERRGLIRTGKQRIDLIEREGLRRWSDEG